MEYYFMEDGYVHIHTENTHVSPKFLVKHVDTPLDQCSCSMHAVVKKNGRRYVARRYKGTIKQSVSDMQDEILALLASTWYLDGRVPVETIDKRKIDSAYLNVKAMTSPNFYDIPPYFNHEGVTNNAILKIPKYLAELYKRFDVFYFTRLLGRRLPMTFYRQVWQQLRQGGVVHAHNDGSVGIPWEHDPTEVPSLLVLAARVASVHNRSFGGSGLGANCVYTLNQSLSKLPKVYAKLCKPTHSMNGHAKYVGALSGRALGLMVKILKVREYARKKVWRWEEAYEKSKDVPMFSSAGIRAGQEVIKHDDNYVYKLTVKGKKVHQLDRSNELLMNLLAAIKRGEIPVISDRAWALIEKNEVLCGRTYAEIDKFQTKCRLYNIPSLLIYRIAKMVHSYRQVIERGDAIAIGINFWSGGAWKLAQRFHALEEGFIYFSGDFSALDTTIKAALLRIYSAFSDFYMKKTGDYQIFKVLLGLASENLTFKCVHFFDNIWRMVYGGMPSGAYETSHGDSWIVCFLYMQYLIAIGDKFPHIKNTITEQLEMLTLLVVVYGDDSILCVPKFLRKYVSIYGFAEFVGEYYQMVMRDLEETTFFLSVPNQKTGGLKERGVVFLSKYFVHRDTVTTRTDLPEILPYREFSKISTKYTFGSGAKRAPRDHVLAALGLVYDSMGTNKQAYIFCKYMFEANLKLCTNFGDVLQYAQDKEDKYFTTLIRKCNISLERLSKGFPTRDELLDMHRWDPTHHVTRDRPDFQFTWK